MQDNKLQDQGWEQMRVLLDKELPVNRKNRGIIALIFASIFLIGVSAFGLSDWWRPENTEKLISSKDQEVLVEISDEINELPQSDINPLSNKVEKAINSPRIINESEKSQNEKVIIAIDDYVKENPELDSKNNMQHKIRRSVSEGDHIISSTPKPRIVHEDSEIPPLDISDLNTKEEITNVKSIEKIEGKSILENLEKINKLDISSNFVTISNPISILDVHLTDYQRRKFGNNEIVLGVMAHVPFYSNIQGLSFGVGYKRRINNLLYVNALINYSSNVHQRSYLQNRNNFDTNSILSSGESDPVEPDFSDPTVEGISNSDGELKSEYFNSVVNNFKNLNYLSIPIDLEYQITKRNSVAIGIQYSFLLNNPFEMALQESAFNTNLLDSASNVFAYVNRHNFSLNGNYRYKINRNFNLKGSLNYGLNKILKTDSQVGIKNNVNYIGFGIEYRLKV